MKNLKIGIITFSTAFYSIDSLGFIESVDRLARQTLEATEHMEEVQITKFKEDTEKIDYWVSNAEVQAQVSQESVFTQEPCKEKREVAEQRKVQPVNTRTRLGLLVKYNNKELTQTQFPINQTPKVGSYLNRIFQESEMDRNMTIREASKDLSFEEKIALASHIGKRFDSNYDFERAKTNSDSSKGIVTLKQLIDGYNQRKRTGICRDIAVGQVQIMNQMGLDCKVTGYVTSKSKGHATTVCTDPKNPDKTIRINYGEVMATDQAGTTALNQNGMIPGTTVTYRLYNEKGEFVTGLKTDLGKLLSDASGADPSEIDWQERYDHNIAKVNIYDIGNVFYGETTDGHTVIGVAADRESQMDLGVADLNVKTGGAFSHVTNEYDPDNPQGVFFFRAQADVASKPLKLGKSTKVRAKLGANNTSTVHFGLGEEGESKDQTNSNFTLDLVPSLEAQAKISKQTVAKIDVGSKFETGMADVREEDGGYMLSRSADFVHTSLSHKFSNDIAAVVTATVVNRNQLGQTGQLGTSVEGDTFKSTLVYDSRLDNSTPGYVPGATPTVTFTHEQQINKNIKVHAGASKALKGDKQLTLFMGGDLRY